ncbi:protein kinase domain containing protein [Acanthamoeba castellanii str. Neff]|uniref:Protein kinase domain containing protein n=1 Tax=Acanthamoeba castellanii (strain ATCC 30010 / Neff) TaxID=1257118 RepID=L8HKU2_ACACF|nr:protein kinase domain containing protein [Acanthamoeba castellanii str. Neff]ELR25293.1 protein kinase domain containing protein [Acanthamoeba castellanii str. Neff]
MEATFGQDLKKLEYLWTRGASIDCHDETNGYTPLHWAIINDKQHSVSWLLTHEAKVNAKDSMGWTPLHYAAHSSKTDVTRALLERGASPSLKNNKGKLPVDIAKSRVIAKLLKEAKDKEKGPSSRLSWFGFKATEGTSSSSALINNAAGKTATARSDGRRRYRSDRRAETEERRTKRVDLDQRERELDDLRDGLTLKEKELYLKEQELTESEQRINSKEGWVGMREKELLKLEKRVDKQKEKLVSRERALVEAEEKHRAAVQVIKWEEMKLGELLGSGAFADVYKADWRGDYVAVKVIKNQRDDDTFRLQFQQESLFLSKLRHYHVVQLMGVCVEYPHMSIVMELMSNNTLAHLLKATRRGETRIPAQLLLQLAREIAKGMNFLHMMDPPLIHRDLKVKIGDVGFMQTKDEDLREGAQDSFAGTPSYMAPECLRQEPYDQKCDVYSYGNVLWELLTQRKPWKGKKRMEIVALAGYNRDKLPMPTPHSLPEGVPQGLLEIMARCWADVPSDRPSFARILTLLPAPTSSN